MLAPLLMPDTTRSGRVSISPVSATWTQSDGVPFTAMKPLDAVRTDRGRFSVRELEAPLWLVSGATTVKSPKPCSAATSASSPGAE
ncbi:hypothetical protein G6F31_021487 [Rhizopus arrhizus]|nr:hypothetical protein G6F24_017293 [Rhizopus arrhizus]KAG0912109.1 hypothetical protein G6F31_021487 [Rhizopus arrhizus]